MRRLAIYGLTGAGKSTACGLAVDICRAAALDVRVVKLGEPLYRLQSDIYRQVGRSITHGQQDQGLLRDLARHLRRIEPTYLVDDFLGRVEQATADGADVVINDDLKDTGVDYPLLVQRGFKFLHITCPEEVRAHRLAGRADITQVAESDTTWRFDRIRADWAIDNSTNDLGDLRAEIQTLLSGWSA